jgi:iron complex outermembrane receptor protein
MRLPRPLLRQLMALVLILPSAALDATADSAADGPPLTELTLEELMDVEVTLPSRRPEALSNASAAIYVVTQDDIRRSGVTNIPDALRLAPGVQVAEANSSQWFVGIRGFASRLNPTLLALMDGRSLYTPLFAGTYWEVQNTFLEDIDRIEVVRGPGGALWGPNAFNGVINIVTKSARETQGLSTTAGGGTEDRAFGRARYGGHIGDDVYYRFYGMYFDRAAFPTTSGSTGVDGWADGQGGFRVDWQQSADDSVTLQGDLYSGSIGQNTPIIAYEPPFVSFTDKHVDVSGGNVLGRWNRRLGASSDLTLQVYYDHTLRRDPTFTEDRNTGDIDFQHRIELPWRNEFMWGGEYRISADATHGIETIQFDPPSETLNLGSVFLQDEWWLVDDELRITAGSRFDTTTYSHFDYEPSVSFLWLPLARNAAWGSVSRAVRTPSRIERGLLLSGQPINLQRPDNTACLPAGARCAYPQVTGNPQFETETTLAYQLGYRLQPAPAVFADVATFFNEYDHLETLERLPSFDQDSPPLPHTLVPLLFTNQLHGKSYGVEVSITTRPTSWSRLSGTYAYLVLDLQEDQGSTDVSNATLAEKASPHNEVTMQGGVDLPWSAALDGVFRYVDQLQFGAQQVPAYATFDVRLAKTFASNIELALVGRNLGQATHVEAFPGQEVPRGMYGQVRCRF